MRIQKDLKMKMRKTVRRMRTDSCNKLGDDD